MPKARKKLPKRVKVETVAIPDAENAKWLAFGFLASLILVAIFCFIALQAKGH